MRRQDSIRKMRFNLLRRREAIRKSLDDACSQMQTTLDREVGDSVDVALDAEYHEISSQLAEVESTELAQINVALERIADGTYGTCEDCDRNIPIARLQAVPYATVCIKCQRQRELHKEQESCATPFVDLGNRDVLYNGNGTSVS